MNGHNCAIILVTIDIWFHLGEMQQVGGMCRALTKNMGVSTNDDNDVQSMNAMLYSKWKNPSSTARKDLAGDGRLASPQLWQLWVWRLWVAKLQVKKSVVACKQFGDRCMPDSKCFGYSQTGFYRFYRSVWKQGIMALLIMTIMQLWP